MRMFNGRTRTSILWIGIFLICVGSLSGQVAVTDAELSAHLEDLAQDSQIESQTSTFLQQRSRTSRYVLQSADTPIDISPNRNVDEELFLVNTLEYTYATWPTDQDRSKMLDSLENKREALTNLRQAIASRSLDPRLAKVYDDCLHLIDANETYLTNLGLIDQHALGEAKRRAAGIALNSGIHLAKERFQGSDAQDMLEGVGIDALLSVIKQGWQVASQRQAAISTENKRLTDITRATLDETKSQIRALSLRRGWTSDEADFYSGKNKAEELIRLRPRDPFPLQRLCLAAFEKVNSSSDAVSSAHTCIDGARMFPAGYFYYDLYRIGLIGYALDYVLTAAALESGGIYSGGQPPSTLNALQLSRTYLALNTSDPEGSGHAGLARALAYAGRYEDAVAAANTALSARSSSYAKDPAFCYRYAKLMSLMNSPDKAAEWLSHALSIGWRNIVFTRTDPDLANLRRARPERFSELTTVAVRAQLQPAWLLHNALFYNDSAFDVTNVRVELNVTVNHQPLEPVVITIERIPAKQTHVESNAVSFTGSSYDMTLTIDCDQCAKTPAYQSTVNTSQVPRPSFNCANATTPSEELICNDATLAAEERQMAEEYASLLRQLSGEEQLAFRAEHGRWFRQYKQACNGSMAQEDRKACIAEYLEERIKQLEAKRQ